MNILVSGCLLGIPCRYDGKRKEYEGIRQLMEQHVLIPVCPEQLGGLATPRPSAERAGDRVMNCRGEDVTAFFRRGAQQALELAKLYGCECAVLKERSPSCGSGQIYDGSFVGRLIPGDGMTANVLKSHGIRVIGESQIEKFLCEPAAEELPERVTVERGGRQDEK